MQSPTLDERERGGQNREGHGRLQEPGTTPDVVLLILRIRPTVRNSPWGKILSRGGASGFHGQRPNFVTPGRGLQGSPARRSRDAPERPSLLPRRSAAVL